MKKGTIFEEFVKNICSKTRTEIPIVLSYKLKYYIAWCGYKEKVKRWQIKYHPERISHYNDKKLLHIAAHEVGHIRGSNGNRTQREFNAELFALKTIRKHYPRYFTLSFTKATIRNPINEKYYREPFKRALQDFKKWEAKC